MKSLFYAACMAFTIAAVSDVSAARIRVDEADIRNTLNRDITVQYQNAGQTQVAAGRTSTTPGYERVIKRVIVAAVPGAHPIPALTCVFTGTIVNILNNDIDVSLNANRIELSVDDAVQATSANCT